jgi:hypothetical protein
VALPFTLKIVVSQGKEEEEEFWKLKYFTMPKYNLKKKSSKKAQKNPSRHHNSITNLKPQTQAKISSFKNPHIIKIDLSFIT